MANIIGGSVVWNLDVDPSKFNSGLQGAERDAAGFGNQLNRIDFKAFASNAASSFSSIAEGLGQILRGVTLFAAGSTIGFGAAAKAAFDQVRQVENASFALKAYETNADKVNQVLSQLVQYARSDLGVLFQRQDLFDAASTLKIYGDETDKLVGHVKVLSKGVAIGKTSFQELSEVLGQIIATGRVTSESFELLARRGIKLPDVMRNTAVSADQLFEALDKSLPDSILEGRANTIQGSMVRLQSAFRDTGSAILGVDKDTSTFIKGGLGDTLVKSIDTLRLSLKDPAFLGALKNIGSSFGEFAKSVIPLLLSSFKFIGENIGTITSLLGGLVTAFIAAKIAAIGFAIVAAANPITLIAGGIVILIGAITALELKFGIFSKTFKALYDLVVKGNFTKAFREIFHIQEDSPIISVILTIRSVIADLIKSVADLSSAIGKSLAPVFDFISQHADIFKKVLIAIVAVALAPFVLGIASIVIGLKLLSVVIQFVADHFETITKIIGVALAIVFWPLTIVIGAIILLVKNWGSIMDWFVGIWQSTYKFISKTTKAIGSIISSVFTSVLGVITTVMNGVALVIQTVFTVIWAIISPILSVIKNLFIIVFGSILLVVLQVLIFLKAVIIETFSFIYNLISTILIAVWSIVTTVWDAIYQVFSTVLGAIWAVISTVLGFIGDQIVNSFNFWYGIISTVLTSVFNFINGIWNSIWSVISSITGKIIALFSGAWNWLYEPGKAIITGLVNGIKAAVNWVWDAIKTAGDKIGEFFSGAWNWLYDTGKAIIMGMVRGIKDAIGAIKDAAGDIGNAVKDKVRNLLGIHSPSKVFYGYGTNISQGLVDGINDGMGKVQMAANDLSSTLKSPDIINDPTYGSSSSGSGVTINQKNEIYNQVDLDLSNRELGWQLANS